MSPAAFFDSFLGGALNMGATAYNNTAAAQREQRARYENFQYNEMAADAADARTRALYKDLYSPKAQIEQLKAAGLSPSVFYGDAGGISGQTGAQGAGASGIAPNIFGADPLQGAQIANLLAEAGLKEAQKEEINGTNEMGKAKIADYLASAGYKEAASELAKVQATGQQLDNYITEQGTDAQLYMIHTKARQLSYETQTAYEEMQQAKLLTQFQTDTFELRKQEEQAKYNNLVQSIIESKSKVKLNEQETRYLFEYANKLYNDVLISWQQLDLNEKYTTSYSEYFDKKASLLQGEYENEVRGLDIQNRKMYVDAISDVAKAITIGVITRASFGGGNPTTPNPAAMGLPKKGANGGKATISRGRLANDETWAW